MNVQLCCYISQAVLKLNHSENSNCLIQKVLFIGLSILLQICVCIIRLKYTSVFQYCILFYASCFAYKKVTALSPH